MKLFKLSSVAILTMALIVTSCSDGENGSDGLPGADGTACWDANNDGIKDDSEDINNDGQHNALDCVGADGAGGADGENRPNVDFFFQEGFKGYAGTVDAEIEDGAGVILGETLNLRNSTVNPQETRVVLRFNNIGDIINSEFNADNTNCGDNYQINQAILYLYSTEVVGAGNSGGINFGFFAPEDPLFDESLVSWNAANGVEGWDASGAESVGFVGPFPGSDDYFHSLGTLENDTDGKGWVAIPMPRSVVNSWACDATGENNKGMRLRLSFVSVGSYRVEFVSKDSPLEDLRPVLVVQTEEINAAAKGGVTSSKSKSWENMSHEERMAPLYKFLSSK